MKLELVQFKNGTYGIRKRTLFGYKFLSRSREYWWNLHYVLDFCQFDSLEDARKIYDAVTDKGKPVKL